jgi:glycosyltransferase involved in cell wall biosynthesis
MSSLDIVVPCYRYGHFLRECVESVLTQSHSDLRVLIIDDASPDKTAEVAHCLAQEDKRVTFRRHSENKGHIATYNEGLEWSAGEYLLLLSADDYLLPGALSRTVHVFEAHPEVGMVIGKAIELFDGNHPPQTKEDVERSEDRPSYRIMAGLEFIEFSGCRNQVPTPTAVVRTKLQKQLGGYRPELPHAGDMEMWLRFAAHASVGILEEYQAVYRRHSANMSLIYVLDGSFGDIEQRKAAINSFIDTCREKVPHSEQLHRRLLWLLGCDAIGFASTAFNAGDIQLCQQLSTLARRISPRVNKSWPWIKLQYKRHLGLRAWRALAPAAAWFRQIGIRIDGDQ